MTAKQLQLLDFIKARISETGVSPSYQEIAEHMGLKSRSGVHRLVHALKDQGHIEMLPGRARTLMMPDNASTAYKAHEVMHRLNKIAHQMELNRVSKREAARQLRQAARVLA